MSEQRIKDAAKRLSTLSTKELETAYNTSQKMLSCGAQYTEETMDALISIIECYEQTHKKRNK